MRLRDSASQGLTTGRKFNWRQGISDLQLIVFGVIGMLQLFALLAGIGLFTAAGGIKIVDQQKSGYTFTLANFFMLFALAGFLFTQFVDQAKRDEYRRRLASQTGPSKWAQPFSYPGAAMWVALKVIMHDTVQLSEMARDLVPHAQSEQAYDPNEYNSDPEPTIFDR